MISCQGVFAGGISTWNSDPQISFENSFLTVNARMTFCKVE